MHSGDEMECVSPGEMRNGRSKICYIKSVEK